MVDSDEDRGRSRRLGAEDQRWSSTCRILGGLMTERSGDIVHDVHYAQGDEERRFLGLASKPRSMVSSDLASKLVATVLLVWPQNHFLGFPNLGLKIVTAVW
jgi:hypothetical protein